MKEYRAVHLFTGDWGVQRYADNVLIGLVVYGLQTEAEAVHAAYRLARAEIVAVVE